MIEDKHMLWNQTFKDLHGIELNSKKIFLNETTVAVQVQTKVDTSENTAKQHHCNNCKKMN